MPTLHLSSDGSSIEFECRCGETIRLAPPHHDIQAHGTGEVTATPKFICMACARVGYVKRAETSADIRWSGAYSPQRSGRVAVPADPSIHPAIVVDKRLDLPANDPAATVYATVDDPLDRPASEAEEEEPEDSAPVCGASLASGGTCSRPVSVESELCFQHEVEEE